MRPSLVEHARSVAEVHRQDNDELVCRSSYDLKVWQPYRRVQDLSGTNWMPTLKRIEGRVTDPIPSTGEPLYLTLPDGRRINFFVNGPDGSVANMSGGTFP
jgi:hypothetical protein